MVVSIVGIYRVTPGRGDEFRSVALAHKQYIDSFGAESHWRINVFAGEATAELLLISYYPDADARVASVDRLLADRANNPMTKALNAANPPGVLLRRSTLEGVGATASAPAPTPPAVLVTRGFETTAANRASAIAAIEGSRERGVAFGLNASSFEAIMAGSNYGRLIRGVAASSFAEVLQLARTSIEVSEPDPLEVAKQAGVLTEISRGSSVLYEV
jgi:hypothetical protein